MRSKGCDRVLEHPQYLGYIDPGTGFTIAGGLGWLVALIASFFGVVIFKLKKIKNFFRKHRKILLILAAIAIIAAGITAINHIGKSNFKNKVIILGFDGLEPKIIESLMDQGLLPNFARLRALGSYAPLTTTVPSQSPVAWSGFATGSNPAKHGLCDFIIRDPQNYKLSLSTSRMRGLSPQNVKKIPSFWEYASEKKVPTTILSCPVTFPPDKVYGKMLSGMGVPDILGTEGTFTYYTSEAVGNTQDVGGKVFKVARSEKMMLDLIGPRKKIGDRIENTKTSFEVALKNSSNKAEIKLERGERFFIEKGQWSGWQPVSFKIDALRTVKGIFKFYLVETEPEFKLYISPINLDPRSPFFPISYPKNYSKELVDAIGLFHTQGMPVDTWAVNENRLGEKELLNQIDAVFGERRSMLNVEMARLKSGMLFVYFEDADIIQHMFWRYRDEGHPLYEKDAPDEYKEAIKNCYIKLDAVVEDAMTGLREGDTLIVLSDHGFGTFRRAAHINSWLKSKGYLKLKENRTGSGELLEDVDWTSTKVYAVGFGAIYINQRGREAQGIVEPGRETEDLKAEIATKMQDWIDDKNNESVVKRVYPQEEIFWGPHIGEMPDLYVGFNPGYRASWQTALGAVPEVLLEDNLKKWSGDHLFDSKNVPGVLFTNQHIKTKTPSIYDIAPSVLKLIGYNDEEIARFGMDGKEIF